MSWSRQLTPAVLRRTTSLLYASCSTLNTATFSHGTRHKSHVSPTPTKLGALDINDLLGRALEFKGSPSVNKSPADMWADKSDNLKLPPPPNTWTGRRVAVQGGDLQGAFHLLNLRLRQNRVAKEIALTVRHEKKGDKRARLCSERWRKRFADAVRKKVQLVSTIRRRGG